MKKVLFLLIFNVAYSEKKMFGLPFKQKKDVTSNMRENNKEKKKEKVTVKEITFSVRGIELVMYAFKDKAIIKRAVVDDNNPDYRLLIDVSSMTEKREGREDSLESRKDDRFFAFVNMKDEYYISTCCSELNSIAQLRRMFSVEEDEEPNINISSNGDQSSRAAFTVQKYTAYFDGSDVEVEFSLDAKRDIQELVKYDLMFDFISEIDLKYLGIIDVAYGSIRAFISKSSNLGFVTYIHLWAQDQYVLEKISDVEVSEDIFDLPKDFDKKGLDALVTGEFF